MCCSLCLRHSICAIRVSAWKSSSSEKLPLIPHCGFTLSFYAHSTLWTFFPNVPKAWCCELQNGHSNAYTTGLLWLENHRVFDKAWHKGSVHDGYYFQCQHYSPCPILCPHHNPAPRHPHALSSQTPSPSPNIHCFHDALGVAANFNDED